MMSGGKLTYMEYIPPSINFTMRTFTSSCLYWSIENDTWKSDGCVVRISFLCDIVELLKQPSKNDYIYINHQLLL